jgi:hypothetical protein
VAIFHLERGFISTAECPRSNRYGRVRQQQFRFDDSLAGPEAMNVLLDGPAATMQKTHCRCRIFRRRRLARIPAPAKTAELQSGMGFALGPLMHGSDTYT